jgi:glycerol uptake facilitator-like aquaporin
MKVKIKKFLIDFIITFVLVFVVNTIVIYVSNLIRYGAGAFDWGLSFALAVGIGIALPLIHTVESKE